MSRRRDPSDLSIEDAIERFLGRHRSSKAEATVREYGYRLRRFAEWCDDQGIETVGELHPLDWDDYLAAREATGIAPITLHKHFQTIRTWAEFLESLGAVDDGLADAVPRPDMPRGSEIDDTMLAPQDGDALIRWYRTTDSAYGRRDHALLEVLWFTGCRLGSLRALDLDDVDLKRRSITFRHQPDLDTPLKRGIDGERAVAIPPATAAVLREYVDHHRTERRDDHGRRPFFTTEYGRPGTDTIRNWSYMATQPCLHTDCPHGKQRETCEWTSHDSASKCPSSRSPHQVRTGAITRMLHHIPRERVEHRANTSQFDHYDMADQDAVLEERDREHVPDLELSDEDEQDDDHDTEDDQQ